MRIVRAVPHRRQRIGRLLQPAFRIPTILILARRPFRLALPRVALGCEASMSQRRSVSIRHRERRHLGLDQSLATADRPRLRQCRVARFPAGFKSGARSGGRHWRRRRSCRRAQRSGGDACSTRGGAPRNGRDRCFGRKGAAARTYADCDDDASCSCPRSLGRPTKARNPPAPTVPECTRMRGPRDKSRR